MIPPADLKHRTINPFPVRSGEPGGGLLMEHANALNETDFLRWISVPLCLKIWSALTFKAPGPTVDRHRLCHPPHETFQDDAKTKARQHIGEPMGQQHDARADKQRADRPSPISYLG